MVRAIKVIGATDLIFTHLFNICSFKPTSFIWRLFFLIFGFIERPIVAPRKPLVAAAAAISFSDQKIFFDAFRGAEIIGVILLIRHPRKNYNLRIVLLKRFFVSYRFDRKVAL